MAELRAAHAQRAQLQGQAVRPADRRQPVDRLGRDRRPLRQAQRVLRQERHQDGATSCPPPSRATRPGPRARKNYWALPAMGDAVAFTYRKDWFARPELQAEFKQKHSRDLAPPKTWDEFKQVAQFFQNRTIDGKKVYGAALYTERGSEGITMGVTNTLYAYGFEYANPAKPYDMKGYVNGARRREGPEVLQGAVRLLRAARPQQRLHDRGPGRLQVGPGGDADELHRVLPRHLQGPASGRREDRLLPDPQGRQAVRAARRPGHLGGQVLRQEGHGAAST